MTAPGFFIEKIVFQLISYFVILHSWFISVYAPSSRLPQKQNAIRPQVQLI